MSHIGGEKKGSLRINPVDFFCRCSKEAFVSKVRLLDRSELEELAATGSANLTCHNCNTAYSLSAEELRAIVATR